MKRIATQSEMLRQHERARKLAMPPAAYAPDLATSWQNEQHFFGQPPADDGIERTVAKSKYYTRGYDWETIPENIARLHTMREFALKHPIKMHTLGGSDENDYLNHAADDIERHNKGWQGHWADERGGQWDSLFDREGVHHRIDLHPLASPDNVNHYLWHELQHAYQHEEGFMDHAKRDIWDHNSPGYSDQEDEIDADALATYMNKYPLVRATTPQPNPHWFDSTFHQDNGTWNDQTGESRASDEAMHGAIRTWRNLHGA